jgi:phage terminase small subunit
VTGRPLTPKQRRFVEEYLVDLNAKRAAIRAGYSARTAEQLGYQLLQNPSVAEAIERAQQARSERTRITQDEVLRYWWDQATADPNELIELQRVCCRYCHGVGHRYQRTNAELERDLAAHERLVARWRADDGPAPAFDAKGGPGYDVCREPHPECPECCGEGIERLFVKDTRTVSRAARRIYAGVKQTRDGFEIKLRDQDSALLKVAKHLGMFTERAEAPASLKSPEEAASEIERLLTRVRGRMAAQRAPVALVDAA